jgi:hypothetical protein
MPILIEQSALSGNINFIPYRYLLDARLTDERLMVSLLGKPLVDLSVANILEVQQIRTIVMFGLKIKYQSKPHLSKVFYLKTREYRQWAQAFASVGVTVYEPNGWFAFDGLDYFRQ